MREGYEELELAA